MDRPDKRAERETAKMAKQTANTETPNAATEAAIAAGAIPKNPEGEVDKSTEEPKELEPAEDWPEAAAPLESDLDTAAKVVKHARDAKWIVGKAGETPRADPAYIVSQVAAEHPLFDPRGYVDLKNAQDDEALATLVASVLNKGIADAIKVALTDNGQGEQKLHVVDGRHRTSIARLAINLLAMNAVDREVELQGIFGSKGDGARMAKLLAKKMTGRKPDYYFLPVVVLDPSIPANQLVEHSIEANQSQRTGPTHLAHKVEKLLGYGYSDNQIRALCRANIATVEMAKELASWSKDNWDDFMRMHRLNLGGPACAMLMCAIPAVRQPVLAELLEQKVRKAAKKDKIRKMIDAAADEQRVYPWISGSTMDKAENQQKSDADAEGGPTASESAKESRIEAAMKGKGAGRIANAKQVASWLEELSVETFDADKGRDVLGAIEVAEGPDELEVLDSELAVAVGAAVVQATLQALLERDLTGLEDLGLGVLAPKFLTD